MANDRIRTFVEEAWRGSIVPALRGYIAIPNQSPAFDPEWRTNGHLDRAVESVAGWVREHAPPGSSVEIVRLGERTPVLLVEVPGTGPETVLLYGHLDKQPPMQGWGEGLGPWQPVLRDGKLYGRGAADDGYSAFAAITAIAALRAAGLPHARSVLLIEACEESGSFDLPAYVDFLAERIGTPGLVVCLDSGAGDYERLWVTTSLRGLITGNLTVSTLSEGVHSGAAGGIVPSSFRIARQLLSRIEDESTGEIRVGELFAPIPAERRAQAEAAAAVLGAAIYDSYPLRPGVEPVTRDLTELLLNRTWRPALEITGGDGLPPPGSAGNVLRPRTTLKLSLRLPPTVAPAAATRALGRRLEDDPPHGASVAFEAEPGAAGWNAPPLDPWLAESLRRASLEFFGREACYLGEGGSIPFMAMLGERFPAAGFVITGVLGPRSNAHGPNEFLHLAMAENLTACIARLLADHFVAAQRIRPRRRS